MRRIGLVFLVALAVGLAGCATEGGDGFAQQVAKAQAPESRGGAAITPEEWAELAAWAGQHKEESGVPPWLADTLYVGGTIAGSLLGVRVWRGGSHKNAVKELLAEAPSKLTGNGGTAGSFGAGTA